MRTLLISDLHLGQRPGHDVLRLPAARERLLSALEQTDRLVLLGDTVELGSRMHRRRPLEVAAPILREIGERMGPDGEIILVAGNHDSVLVRDWVLQRGAGLGLADAVPVDATPTLAAVTAMLSPARVRVSHPGFWVRDDVWATHGHYLDRHLVPESTFGLPRGRLRDPAPGGHPEDYERARRQRARRRRESRGLLSDLRERPVATVLEHAFELTRHATRVLGRSRLSPLTVALLDLQARHAAVPAMARVSRRLGVEARWVVFGHIHRAGPDPGERWEPWPGAPQILNTGSWVHEPLLLARASAPHPYWPGGAVRVGDTGPPEVLHLLDDLPGAQLSAGAGSRAGAGGGAGGGAGAGASVGTPPPAPRALA